MKAADVIKKSGKTDGKSNKYGGGGRFKQMEKKGMSDKLIAWIGQRNHGKKSMEEAAEKGKERAKK